MPMVVLGGGYHGWLFFVGCNSYINHKSINLITMTTTETLTKKMTDN